MRCVRHFGFWLFISLDGVCFFVFNKEVLEKAIWLFRSSFYDAKIFFLEFAVFDFIVKNAESCRIFCRNNDSAGVAVDSVAKCGNKGVFVLRVIFAFFVKIMLDSCDKGICAPLVAFVNKKTCGFVYEKDVFVLINNGNIGRSKHKFRTFFLNLEKFIGNVTLNDIANGKTA